MTSRCRWMLGLGCWVLSVLIAPDTWNSIGTETPSTAYAAAESEIPVTDVWVAEHPSGRAPRPFEEAIQSERP